MTIALLGCGSRTIVATAGSATVLVDSRTTASHARMLGGGATVCSSSCAALVCPPAITPCAEPATQSGAQFFLQWNDSADLDLIVTTPNGEEHALLSSSRGACADAAAPFSEQLLIENTEPGPYMIEARRTSSCGATTASVFVVRVYFNGSELGAYTGSLATGDNASIAQLLLE